MRPYDVERLLIGLVLVYGNEASRICLPQLGPDKFVFGYSGEFGYDHKELWKKIREAVLVKNISPLLAALTLSPNQHEYADKLRHETFTNHPTLDTLLVKQLMERVDKQGVIYNVAKDGHQLGSILSSVETFMQTADNISDIERWSMDHLSKFRSNVSIQSEGYEHISDIAPRLKERWYRQLTGQHTPVLNCGIPTLVNNALFPETSMFVLHGLSGSGKTTLALQVNLGVAIHLYNEGLPGCVVFNSLEMTAENLVQRLCAILAHVNVAKFLTNSMTQQEHAKLTQWLGFVEALPIFVDDTSFLTTTAMEYRASGLHVSEHGPVVQLSSDYGELFRDDSGNSEEQRVNKVFRAQLNLSREIGASILAISQSTNDTRVSGKTYIAGPDGTRYSRAILQTADGLVEVWNPVQIEKSMRVIKADNIETSHPWLFIQKYRENEVGTQIPLGWIPETTTFFDMSLSQTPGKEIVYTHLDAAVDKFNKENQAW